MSMGAGNSQRLNLPVYHTINALCVFPCAPSAEQPGVTYPPSERPYQTLNDSSVQVQIRSDIHYSARA